jgi:hypothetical protein
MSGIQESQMLEDVQNVKAFTGTGKRKKLTQKRLKEVLVYNPKTGIFMWKKTGPGRKKTKIAGGIDVHGYRVINIFYTQYKAARIANLYMLGYLPENQMDHKNKIRDDDRWKNLREVSAQCNLRNCCVYKNNKSGVTGISFGKKDNRWLSDMRVNNKTIHLGQYKDKTDAIKARWEAEKKHNYPNCQTTSSAYLYLKERGMI